MYHALVRRKLTETLEGLDATNASAALAGMDPTVEHYFAGQHALGGTRRSREAVGRWFERVFRLLPDLRFQVRRIAVSGWPWDTTATAEWRCTGTTPTGDVYRNLGAHVVRLRLGKIRSMHVYLDSQALAEVLRAAFDKGDEEAGAAPIES